MAKECLKVKQREGRFKFKVRRYHRCGRCARARAYMRRFGLCRVCMRELANQGLLPGVMKASW